MRIRLFRSIGVSEISVAATGLLLGSLLVALTSTAYGFMNEHYERRAKDVYLVEVVRPRLVEASQARRDALTAHFIGTEAPGHSSPRKAPQRACYELRTGRPVDEPCRLAK